MNFRRICTIIVFTNLRRIPGAPFREIEKTMMWLDKPYHSLDYEMKTRYGHKVYKIALDGGFTCPTRDGTLGTGGCIFCSAGGSGEFAQAPAASVFSQIQAGKKLLAGKKTGNRYIAYFQAFTSTYAPADRLRALYTEAISQPEVEILSIATRPDCLEEPVLDLLAEMNQIKPVWVELGLQTSNETTARLIRRAYPNEVFASAVRALKSRGIETIVHLILGLPGETEADMLESACYLADLKADGVKFQMLQVLKGTDLEKSYASDPFHLLSLEEYTDILISCIEQMPPEMVIHRITGDPPKRLLTAPEWTADKKRVLNYIHHRFKDRNTFQGKERGDRL